MNSATERNPALGIPWKEVLNPPRPSWNLKTFRPALIQLFPTSHAQRFLEGGLDFPSAKMTIFLGVVFVFIFGPFAVAVRAERFVELLHLCRVLLEGVVRVVAREALPAQCLHIGSGAQEHWLIIPL